MKNPKPPMTNQFDGIRGAEWAAGQGRFTQDPGEALKAKERLFPGKSRQADAIALVTLKQ